MALTPSGSPGAEIGPHGQKALDALAEAIEEGDPELLSERTWVVQDLDCRGHAVPLLIEALDHEDLEIRKTAIYRLRRLAPFAEEAVPALVAQLGDSSVGFQAGCTLVAIGPKAVPALIEALKSPSEQGRAEAYRVLTNMGPPAEAAVPALTEALEDPKPRVRSSAAYTLAGIGPSARAALPALKRRLSDDDEHVRAMAHFAVGALAPESVASASTADKLVDANVSDYDRDAFVARKALGRLGPEGFALLLKGLQSEDPDDRRLYLDSVAVSGTR